MLSEEEIRKVLEALSDENEGLSQAEEALHKISGSLYSKLFEKSSYTNPPSKLVVSTTKVNLEASSPKNTFLKCLSESLHVNQSLCEEVWKDVFANEVCNIESFNSSVKADDLHSFRDRFLNNRHHTWLLLQELIKIELDEDHSFHTQASNTINSYIAKGLAEKLINHLLALQLWSPSMLKKQSFPSFDHKEFSQFAIHHNSTWIREYFHEIDLTIDTLILLGYSKPFLNLKQLTKLLTSKWMVGLNPNLQCLLENTQHDTVLSNDLQIATQSLSFKYILLFSECFQFWRIFQSEPHNTSSNSLVTELSHPLLTSNSTEKEIVDIKNDIIQANEILLGMTKNSSIDYEMNIYEERKNDIYENDILLFLSIFLWDCFLYYFRNDLRNERLNDYIKNYSSKSPFPVSLQYLAFLAKSSSKQSTTSEVSLKCQLTPSQSNILQELINIVLYTKVLRQNGLTSSSYISPITDLIEVAYQNNEELCDIFWEHWKLYLTINQYNHPHPLCQFIEILFVEYPHEPLYLLKTLSSLSYSSESCLSILQLLNQTTHITTINSTEELLVFTGNHDDNEVIMNDSQNWVEGNIIISHYAHIPAGSMIKINPLHQQNQSKNMLKLLSSTPNGYGKISDQIENTTTTIASGSSTFYSVKWEEKCSWIVILLQSLLDAYYSNLHLKSKNEFINHNHYTSVFPSYNEVSSIFQLLNNLLLYQKLLIVSYMESVWDEYMLFYFLNNLENSNAINYYTLLKSHNETMVRLNTNHIQSYHRLLSYKIDENIINIIMKKLQMISSTASSSLASSLNHYTCSCSDMIGLSLSSIIYATTNYLKLNNQNNNNNNILSLSSSSSALSYSSLKISDNNQVFTILSSALSLLSSFLTIPYPWPQSIFETFIKQFKTKNISSLMEIMFELSTLCLSTELSYQLISIIIQQIQIITHIIKTQPQKASIRLLFERLDENGDMSISREELTKGIKEIAGIDITMVTIDKLFLQLGIVDKGCIEYNDCHFLASIDTILGDLTKDSINNDNNQNQNIENNIFSSILQSLIDEKALINSVFINEYIISGFEYIIQIILFLNKNDHSSSMDSTKLALFYSCFQMIENILSFAMSSQHNNNNHKSTSENVIYNSCIQFINKLFEYHSCIELIIQIATLFGMTASTIQFSSNNSNNRNNKTYNSQKDDKKGMKSVFESLPHTIPLNSNTFTVNDLHNTNNSLLPIDYATLYIQRSVYSVSNIELLLALSLQSNTILLLLFDFILLADHNNSNDNNNNNKQTSNSMINYFINKFLIQSSLPLNSCWNCFSMKASTPHPISSSYFTILCGLNDFSLGIYAISLVNKIKILSCDLTKRLVIHLSKLLQSHVISSNTNNHSIPLSLLINNNIKDNNKANNNITGSQSQAMMNLIDVIGTTNLKGFCITLCSVLFKKQSNEIDHINISNEDSLVIMHKQMVLELLLAIGYHQPALFCSMLGIHSVSFANEIHDIVQKAGLEISKISRSLSSNPTISLSNNNNNNNGQQSSLSFHCLPEDSSLLISLLYNLSNAENLYKISPQILQLCYKLVELIWKNAKSKKIYHNASIFLITHNKFIDFITVPLMNDLPAVSNITDLISSIEQENNIDNNHENKKNKNIKSKTNNNSNNNMELFHEFYDNKQGFIQELMTSNVDNSLPLIMTENNSFNEIMIKYFPLMNKNSSTIIHSIQQLQLHYHQILATSSCLQLLSLERYGIFYDLDVTIAKNTNNRIFLFYKKATESHRFLSWIKHYLNNNLQVSYEKDVMDIALQLGIDLQSILQNSQVNNYFDHNKQPFLSTKLSNYIFNSQHIKKQFCFLWENIILKNLNSVNNNNNNNNNIYNDSLSIESFLEKSDLLKFYSFYQIILQYNLNMSVSHIQLELIISWKKFLEFYILPGSINKQLTDNKMDENETSINQNLSLSVDNNDNKIQNKSLSLIKGGISPNHDEFSNSPDLNNNSNNINNNSLNRSNSLSKSFFDGDIRSYEVVKEIMIHLNHHRFDHFIKSPLGCVVLVEKCELLVSMLHHQLKYITHRSSDPSKSNIMSREIGSSRMTQDKMEKRLEMLEQCYHDIIFTSSAVHASFIQNTSNQKSSQQQLYNELPYKIMNNIQNNMNLSQPSYFFTSHSHNNNNNNNNNHCEEYYNKIILRLFTCMILLLSGIHSRDTSDYLETNFSKHRRLIFQYSFTVLQQLLVRFNISLFINSLSKEEQQGNEYNNHSNYGIISKMSLLILKNTLPVNIPEMNHDHNYPINDGNNADVLEDRMTLISSISLTEKQNWSQLIVSLNTIPTLLFIINQVSVQLFGVSNHNNNHNHFMVNLENNYSLFQKNATNIGIKGQINCDIPHYNYNNHNNNQHQINLIKYQHNISILEAMVSTMDVLYRLIQVDILSTMNTTNINHNNHKICYIESYISNLIDSPLLESYQLFLKQQSSHQGETLTPCLMGYNSITGEYSIISKIWQKSINTIELIISKFNEQYNPPSESIIELIIKFIQKYFYLLILPCKPVFYRYSIRQLELIKMTFSLFIVLNNHLSIWKTLLPDLFLIMKESSVIVFKSFSLLLWHGEDPSGIEQQKRLQDHSIAISNIEKKDYNSKVPLNRSSGNGVHSAHGQRKNSHELNDPHSDLSRMGRTNIRPSYELII
eukprot:gene5282-7343_t